MEFAGWAALVGLLMVSLALAEQRLARLPLSTSMLYLAVGAATSPLWLGWSALTVPSQHALLEHGAEVAVLISLFVSGLKMSVGLGDGRWLLPLRLAVLSMLLTVAMIAVVGVYVVGLPFGAAVLLGGILAPTDPVLASDVQVANATDRDRLRFALTGEAGLNDGTSYPVVLLGLGLLGLGHDASFGWFSFGIDLVWGVLGGIGIGALFGTAIGWLVLWLRRTRKEAVGGDDFLALGLIGLAYGASVLAHAYGFLAVFAAGVALRRLEQRASGKASRRQRSADVAAEAHADPDVTHAEKVATDPTHAPAFMAHAMLSFNEQIERVGEVVVVVTIGMLLWSVDWRLVSWGFVALLLFVIRPLSVALGLIGSRALRSQRVLIGWFGIRGIGSLYYLAYALNHGVSQALAATLSALTLSVIVVSVVLHGVSVTPLMALYERRKMPLRDRAAKGR